MLRIDELRKYRVVGIRGLTNDENYKIDDELRNSYNWNYEYDCSSYDTDEPEELDGTCAVDTLIDTTYDTDDEIIDKINSVINNFSYTGKIALIAGNVYTYGADQNEIIIEDATLIDYL